MGVNLVKFAFKDLHGVKMRFFNFLFYDTEWISWKKMRMSKNQMLVSMNITFFETFVITLCLVKHLASTFF